MNKGAVLAFFLLVGIFVGIAIKQPLWGVLTGLIMGIVSYLLIPDKKVRRKS